MKELNRINKLLSVKQIRLNQKEIGTWINDNQIDYKSNWKNKKIAIIEIQKIHDVIISKKDERIDYKNFLYKNKENNINKRFKTWKKKSILKILRWNLRFPEKDHLQKLSINFERYYDVKIDKSLDYNFYGQSCKKPANIYTINIDIPENWSKNNIEIEKFDNLANIYCKKIRTINHITIYKVIYLNQKRGYDFDFKSCFVASINKINYHGDTIKSAVIGLQKKIKKQFKNHFITLDQEITKKLYHDITGACMIGINAFCKSHDLLIDKKSIKLSDLLPILENGNAYGLHKLKESIISKNVKSEILQNILK